MTATQKNGYGSSIVEEILGSHADLKGSGKFHADGLSHLVQSIFSSLLDAGLTGESIFHFPSSVSDSIAKKLVLPMKPEPGTLYTCSIDALKTPSIKPVHVCELPAQHSLRQDLIFIMVGVPVCAFVGAYPSHDDEDGEDNFEGFVSFQPKQIALTVDHAIKVLKNELGSTEINDWLTENRRLLLRDKKQFVESRLWGRMLIEFASTLDRYHQTQDGDFKWVRMLSQIQEAVGWELDNDGLFKAVSSVLKDVIGYHYLELEFLNLGNDGWVSEAVMKRNETDYGGELLTLILKPDVLRTVLKEKKPVVLNTQRIAEQYFANARLIPFMSLKSGVIVPLIYANEPNGLLKIFSCNNRHFTKDDLPRMSSIGKILARSVRNVRAHSDLRRMATIDGLTNVFNRRFFTDQINREFERARRYGSSLSVIMTDIDHFKHYNDTNGHLMGDKVLVRVAKILKSSVRGADLVARYGGEEFIVILPETGLDNGKVVAEKVRSSVAEAEFQNEKSQPDGSLTISLGIASITDTVTNANELINRADMALYRAKKLGRNRCEIYNDDQE